jgi:ubiquinone biosynthesis protein
MFALVQNRARAEFIVSVIVKYGLADAATLEGYPLLAQLAGKVKPDPALMEMSRGDRLRSAMQELGTTFIKIGQLLSTRADLVGPDIAEALSALQADDPADTPEQITATVTDDLKMPLDESSFTLIPLASASVGQVCKAVTPDGTEVVVKVRHDGVPEVVAQDLAILNALAALLEKDVAATRVLQPVQVAHQLSTSLTDELDFRRELGNLVRISANFAGNDTYVFPKPFPELSGEAVLTESMLDGTRFSSVINNLTVDQANDIIRMIANMYFQMIFIDGLFHADPHPGNLLILDDGRLGVLDFGKCGRLRDGMREAFIDFLASVMTGDIEESTRCMLKIAPGPADLDETRLQADLEGWIETYFPGSAGSSTMHADLGSAIAALLDIVRQYNLRMPTDMSLMLIVVMQLQGILQESGSSLTLTELLMPFAQEIQKERMSPKRMMRKALSTAHRWEHLIEVLPGDLTRLLEATSRGELKVPLTIGGIDRPVNRLAYALVATATINGTAQMLSRKAGPTVGRVSVPGLIGTAASAYLGYHVIRAIHKAGGLSQ